MGPRDITPFSLQIGFGLTIMALLAVVFSGDSENVIVVEIRAVRAFNRSRFIRAVVDTRGYIILVHL